MKTILLVLLCLEVLYSNAQLKFPKVWKFDRKITRTFFTNHDAIDHDTLDLKGSYLTIYLDENTLQIQGLDTFQVRRIIWPVTDGLFTTDQFIKVVCKKGIKAIVWAGYMTVAYRKQKKYSKIEDIHLVTQKDLPKLSD